MVDSPTAEVFYRYDAYPVSTGVDEFDNPLPGLRVEVYLHRYPVIKYTPKGVWVNVYGRKRFVLLSARKKFACKDLDEALESFLARKRRYLSILSSKTQATQMMMRMAESRHEYYKRREADA